MSIQLYESPLSGAGAGGAGAGAVTAKAAYGEVAKDVNLFNDTLQDLHTSLGSRFMVPTIGGKALNLHRLFVEVTARGGLEQVIRNRQWREIISVFSFPSTITNASFVLRKYYMSLLHQYEQVYYFRKHIHPSMGRVQAATPTSEEKNTSEIVLCADSQQWTGRWVTGSIDGKFDNGYLVTVSFGSEKLKGVLYHVPQESQKLRTSSTSILTRQRNRKRAWIKSRDRDPSHPKPSRSGYNFFYSEHYSRLKSLHRGQEKTISTRVAYLWSKLSEAEKQVYQEKGRRDKERFQKEMLQHKLLPGGPKLK